MTIYTSYFDINTEFAKREAESATVLIKKAVFQVPHMQGICLNFYFEYTIKVTNPDNSSADLTYFTFRSIVFVDAVDNCTPTYSLSLKFV